MAKENEEKQTSPKPLYSTAVVVDTLQDILLDNRHMCKGSRKKSREILELLENVNADNIETTISLVKEKVLDRMNHNIKDFIKRYNECLEGYNKSKFLNQASQSSSTNTDDSVSTSMSSVKSNYFTPSKGKSKMSLNKFARSNTEESDDQTLSSSFIKLATPHHGKLYVIYFYFTV